MPPYGCNTDEQSSQNPDNAIAKKALLSLSDSSAFCVYWNFFGSFFVKKEQNPRKSNRPVLPQPRLQLGGGLVADGPA
ncbi:MAG: hypothetical protein KBH19_03590, partial [Gemmiger sp.]|nr:hypothetical protein [Gemmiger sp.]